jgi:hypothetical protein
MLSQPTDNCISAIADLPPTLFDLLSNILILDNILNYLPLSSLFSLAHTNKSLSAFFHHNAQCFRYVDLSRCLGASIPPSLTHIDSGGHSWRAERIDEHLTEDDIYSGPLRGVLSKLSRLIPLNSVHVLVLDGLASVTSDLVYELLTQDRFDILLLSVVNCINLNPRKLQQILCHICRPSRPEGTPRLKRLYYSGTDTNSTDYAPTGRIIPPPHRTQRSSSWDQTLLVCHGIIAFDAVPCAATHAAMAPLRRGAPHDFLHLTPAPPSPSTHSSG